MKKKKAELTQNLLKVKGLTLFQEEKNVIIKAINSAVQAEMERCAKIGSDWLRTNTSLDVAKVIDFQQAIIDKE